MPRTLQIRLSQADPRRSAVSAIPRAVLDVAPLGRARRGSHFLGCAHHVYRRRGNHAERRSSALAYHSGHFSFERRARTEHLPLYDLLLHLWPLPDGRRPHYYCACRPMLFFLVGVWVLSRAALRIGGAARAATSMIWLASLPGPYGFHYARLGNQLLFFVSSHRSADLGLSALRRSAQWLDRGATFACWRLRSSGRVISAGFCSPCSAWKKWIKWIRQSSAASKRAIPRLAIAAGVLAVASIPLWHTLLDSIRDVIGSHASARAALFNAGYKLYVLMVSESVAPWYWKFGVPGMLAVAASLALIFVAVHGQARGFLLYGASLVGALAMIGGMSSENLLLAAPWFLLAAAVAIGTTHTSPLAARDGCLACSCRGDRMVRRLRPRLLCDADFHRALGRSRRRSR